MKNSTTRWNFAKIILILVLFPFISSANNENDRVNVWSEYSTVIGGSNVDQANYFLCLKLNGEMAVVDSQGNIKEECTFPDTKCYDFLEKNDKNADEMIARAYEFWYAENRVERMIYCSALYDLGKNAFYKNNSTRALEIFTLIDSLSPDFKHTDEFISLSQEKNETQAHVTKIKKLKRHTIGFVVDLPSINHVLAYMSEDLNIDIQDERQMDDPNWDPSNWSAYNFEITKTQDGEYEVRARFFPPADPMIQESVVAIQRKAQITRESALEQLKSDEAK